MSGIVCHLKMEQLANIPCSTIAYDAYSGTCSWAKKLEDRVDDVPMNDFKTAFKNELKAYRGPQQYLMKNITTQAERDDFAELLKQVLPHDKAIEYNEVHPLALTEGDTRTPTQSRLHVSSFNYGGAASLQPLTEFSVACQLADRYHHEGFLTCDAPLKIAFHGFEDGVILPFSIGYVKGQARLTTLLAMLHYYGKHGEVLPNIITSTAFQIIVIRPFLPDARSEVFANMTDSHRGSLRKKPNAVKWVCALHNLEKAGQDPLSVLTAWNSNAPSDDKIVGVKATSVKNLLRLPESCRTPIMQAVSELDWSKCPYSDENLSSKKLVVKASFRPSRGLSPKSPWIKWGEVTEESLQLCFESLLSRYTGGLELPKLTKPQLEMHLESCTLAHHLYMEALKVHAGLQEKLKEDFMDFIRRGDIMILAELDAAIQLKDEGYCVRDCPTIANIINKHTQSGTSVGVKEIEMEKQAAAIDADQWDLLKKQWDYDMNAVRIWQGKTKNAQTAVKSQRQKWLADVISNNTKTAEAMVTSRSSTHVYSSDQAKGTAECIGAYKEAKKSFARNLGIEYSSVITVVWLNYTAPCMISNCEMAIQMHLLNYIMNEENHNIGIHLNPVWNHKKGQVWVVDHVVSQQLARQAACNIDTQFALLFNDRSDLRDGRPMTYLGRILCKSSEELSNNVVWKSSSLVLDGHVGPIPQFQPKSMDVITKLDDDSLPTSADKFG